jgi:gliding motility-associated-like protein
VNGDLKVATEPSVATTATASSIVGTYPITLSGGSDQNYTIRLVSAELEIVPAVLGVTARNKSKIFGQTDPLLSYQVSGLKGTDTEGSVLSGTLSREAGEEPGIYAVGQGSVKANANYAIEFTGGNLEIVPARILAVTELGEIQTAWGQSPVLGSTVQVLTTDGQFFQVGVSWDTVGLNVFARGTYTIRGSFILPNGVENPDKLTITVSIRVLAKPAPRDVSLNNSTFFGSDEIFFIPVGAFVVVDPIDQIHTVSLLGAGYDNGYFEIKDNILFWSSAERAAGKTTFTIVIRVIDRDGNTLDKMLEVTRTRSDIAEIQVENTFTPNNDGLNDTWGIPEIRFFQGASVHLYERSGERVFYTEDPDVRWDGTFKGKDLAVGTYYWVLEIRETGEIRRGLLNLLRN